MLYSVKGELIHLEPKMAVVSCGGVGFRLQITMNTARQLPSIGAEAMLYTVMNVREDAIELFGFADQQELSSFKLLTGISGVGPKVGLSILSELTPERVALAVASGDYKALTKAAGVGPKLAQRIVLELKDKVGAGMTAPVSMGGVDLPASVVVSASSNASQAVEALTVLGFSATEASAAVGKLDSVQPVEVLVRDALKMLARRG
ncbi:MAG: Holliday junction branch migration protein RuvA [Ruminococcaceae bacterium]|nr:Holliday junction branch migration protein RuvA [Oscillospiraceae bacterium]